MAEASTHDLRGVNLNHFRYFEAVAQTGSVSRAARAMNVSPSTVSEQIRALEDHLGRQLFDRGGRALAPTELGRKLLVHVHSMLRAAERGLRELMARPRAALVRVAYTDELSGDQLAETLRDVLRIPALEFTLNQVSDVTTEEELFRAGYDLILSTRSVDPALTSGYECVRLKQEAIVTVVAADARESSPRHVYTNLPMIAPSSDSKLRRAIERGWAARGLTLRVLAESDDLDFVLAAVRAGGCFAPVPESALASDTGLRVVEWCHDLSGTFQQTVWTRDPTIVEALRSAQRALTLEAADPSVSANSG